MRSGGMSVTEDSQYFSWGEMIGREIVYARILQFSIYYFRNFKHFAPFNKSYSRCLRKDWSRNGSLRLPLIKTK